MNKRRDALRALMEPISTAPSTDDRLQKSPVKSGSLKMMGLSLQSLSDAADEAESLREQISAGERVVEIPPDQIDPSFVRDRLDDPRTEDFDALVSSIAEEGQQVPVLVRPSPSDPARYQTAYGHRRVEALRRLGRPVKAIVRNLNDDQLVVAQGKENLERRDLSFIERALFAARLESHGIARTALMSALLVHKGNLSTMITVARSVPEDLIVAIGPAPKAGRPRWEELAQRVNGAEAKWRELVGRSDFIGLDSDARFAAALKAVTPQKKTPTRVIKDQNGKGFARIEQGRNKLRLMIEEKTAPAFGAYLVEQLPEIYAAFRRRGDA